ncbi:hypothetical protein MTCOM_22440 [Moorella thermoacetica]|uniref:hypothetical protein n=1 Tax=Neomoorella thermoacetica TaxID=1525 RepID=UPI0030CE846D
MAKVKVEIYDYPSSGGGCGCGCGGGAAMTTAAIKKQVGELQQQLEEKFAGQAEAVYIDLRAVPRNQVPSELRALTNGPYPAPLVVVDCTPRYAGDIPCEEIIKEVGNILA